MPLQRDILRLLGPDMTEELPPASRTLRTWQSGGLPLQERSFTKPCGTNVPALYLPPLRANAPAILYCHAHGGRYDIGTSELEHGRPALIGPYLPDLADAGFAVLCMEMPCFGSRAHMAEGATAKARLWHGRTLFGQMLAELRMGLSFLAMAPGVDPARIGAMGISMGGTQAFWLAAIDARVRAAVSLCAFADLETLINEGGHDHHGHYMTVPGITRLCSTGALAGCAAPRAQLHCVGLKDWASPLAAFERAREDLLAAYGPHKDNLEFVIAPDGVHEETPAMRKAVLRFLKQHLA